MNVKGWKRIELGIPPILVLNTIEISHQSKYNTKQNMLVSTYTIWAAVRALTASEVPIWNITRFLSS